MKAPQWFTMRVRDTMTDPHELFNHYDLKHVIEIIRKDGQCFIITALESAEVHALTEWMQTPSQRHWCWKEAELSAFTREKMPGRHSPTASTT